MATNFPTCVTQIANITAISSNVLVNGDGNFGPIFPAAIDYAEQRIYRELDLLQTRVGDSVVVSSNNNAFAAPQNIGTFVVIEEVYFYTPPGGFTTLNPLTRTSREFLFATWPSAFQSNALPRYWCQGTPATALSSAINPSIGVGPPTDATYTVLFIGTIRPTPLSAANSSTILTQSLPDLFNSALMVFMSGQMRDFGAQTDNPQMAQSWETQYKTLFASTETEEFRKKYQSQAWTDKKPSPIVTPPRV